MVKTIKKIGNSKGIIFDAALLDLAGLKEGDKLNVTVHEGGTITLVPDVETISSEDAGKAAEEIIAANSELFRRLSL
ncbi:AbrB family transcriptional regulator [Rubritalea spongiae]|uniref:AbrB family transcriptional regulator n=1 Tax=Rubritalea spongiae TaxID=430797 RepID=A0ABW5E5W6_9BACT